MPPTTDAVTASLPCASEGIEFVDQSSKLMFLNILSATASKFNQSRLLDCLCLINPASLAADSRQRDSTKNSVLELYLLALFVPSPAVVTLSDRPVCSVPAIGL